MGTDEKKGPTILITPYPSNIWFRDQSLRVKITEKGVIPKNQNLLLGIDPNYWSLCLEKLGIDPLIKIFEWRDQSLVKFS